MNYYVRIKKGCVIIQPKIEEMRTIDVQYSNEQEETQRW